LDRCRIRYRHGRRGCLSAESADFTGCCFSVTDWTAYVIFIVMIGGVRTIEGPMIGVLTLWGLSNYLAQHGSLYLIVLGAIAILVMLFMPKGVWGEIAGRWGIRLFPTQRVLSRNSCSSDLEQDR